MGSKTGGIDYRALGMNMSEIRDVIIKTFLGGMSKGKRPRSIMVWGPPGCGKTMTISAAARSLGKELGTDVAVFANATSCLEPTDVAGCPTPVKVRDFTRYTSYLPPKWGYFCSTDYEEDMKVENPDFVAPPVLLFFDDIPAAHFQTQTAFFKLVHEGHCGDGILRDNVMIVAAGNRMEDNAGANDMPTALANRFHHVYAAPKPDDWIKWAQTEGGIHPYIVGYIRRNKGHLHEFDEEVANRQEKAFASPRTWEMVSDVMNEELYSYDRNNEDSSMFFKLLAGTIGRGIATNFSGFMRMTDAVVAPDDIVRNPKKAKVPSQKNPSALHATIASLEAHLVNHPEHWRQGMIYASREEMVGDLGILLGRTCIEVALYAEKDAQTFIDSPEFGALAERYENLLSLIEA